MARKIETAEHILTANDLLTGRTVYWTGNSWSPELVDALRVADGAESALTDTARAEEAAQRVVSAYLIGLNAQGAAPALRERHRIAGPSIALPGTPESAAAARSM